MSEPPSVRVCVGSGDLAAQHVKSLRGNGNCGNAGEKYKNPPSFVKKKPDFCFPYCTAVCFPTRFGIFL